MSFLSIKRVNALPGTLDPSTMYIVKSATAGLVDIYFTNTAGTEARHVISRTEIQSLISAAVFASTSTLSSVQIVADITARNALAPTVNTLALVIDASADSTVAAGAALYIFDATVGVEAWVKVSEYESLDVTLLWANIQNKPSSSVANIDDAVSKRHAHTNSAQLAKVGEDGDGNFQYNGAYPQVTLLAEEW